MRVTTRHPRFIETTTPWDLWLAATPDFKFGVITLLVSIPMIVFGADSHRVYALGVLGIFGASLGAMIWFVWWVTASSRRFENNLRNRTYNKPNRIRRIVVEPQGEYVILTRYGRDGKETVRFHAEEQAELAHAQVQEWKEETGDPDSTPEARALANVLAKR